MTTIKMFVPLAGGYIPAVQIVRQEMVARLVEQVIESFVNSHFTTFPNSRH
jgi:hypothetical protein